MGEKSLFSIIAGNVADKQMLVNVIIFSLEEC